MLVAIDDAFKMLHDVRWQSHLLERLAMASDREVLENDLAAQRFRDFRCHLLVVHFKPGRGLRNRSDDTTLVLSADGRRSLTAAV
jgi:hypothetical protein